MTEIILAIAAALLSLAAAVMIPLLVKMITWITHLDDEIKNRPKIDHR